MGSLILFLAIVVIWGVLALCVLALVHGQKGHHGSPIHESGVRYSTRNDPAHRYRT